MPTVLPLRQMIAHRAAPWSLAPRPSLHDLADDLANVVDLTRSYLSDAPPAHIPAAASTALDNGATHYVDRSGLLPLREAICAQYARERALTLTSNQVLVTSGAQEALFVALRALVKLGDEVIIPDPGSPPLLDIIQLAGGVPVAVPIAATEFRMQPEHLAHLLSARTRFVILLSPHNATGIAIDSTDLLQITELAERHRLTVILDEALYAGLYDGSRQDSLAHLAEYAGHWLLISGLSKLHRLSGWRIGWIIGDEQLLGPIRDLKQALSICSAAASQWAAVAALTGPQDWLTAQRADFSQRRDVVCRALDAMGFKAVQPDAAFFLFVDVRATRLSSAQFAEFALREARVLVTPGVEFGAAGEGYVRLSLTESVERLSEAMARLRAALERQR